MLASLKARSLTPLLVLLALACGGGGSGGSSPTEPTRTVSTINVSPSSLTLTVGDTAQLNVLVLDQQGNVINACDIIFTASSNIISVTGTGLVSAVLAGNASVTVRANCGSAGNGQTLVPVTVERALLSVGGIYEVRHEVTSTTCPTVNNLFSNPVTIVHTAGRSDFKVRFGSFELDGTVQQGGVFVFSENIFNPNELSQTWNAQGQFTTTGLAAVIDIGTSTNPDGTVELRPDGPSPITCTIKATWDGVKVAGGSNTL